MLLPLEDPSWPRLHPTQPTTPTGTRKSKVTDRIHSLQTQTHTHRSSLVCQSLFSSYNLLFIFYRPTFAPTVVLVNKKSFDLSNNISHQILTAPSADSMPVHSSRISRLSLFMARQWTRWHPAISYYLVVGGAIAARHGGSLI